VYVPESILVGCARLAAPAMPKLKLAPLAVVTCMPRLALLGNAAATDPVFGLSVGESAAFAAGLIAINIPADIIAAVAALSVPINLIIVLRSRAKCYFLGG